MQPLWKTVWKLLRKLKLELSYGTEIPFLGINPGKTVISKDTCTPMFRAVLLIVAKTRKHPEFPLTDEWIENDWYIYGME